LKIVDSEDLLKAVYTFEDVVLPLPGSETLLPRNEVAGIYHEVAKKVMDFIMNFTVISEDCCGIN